jgi:hypothetical protein
MHLYDRQPMVLQCPRCCRWWRIRNQSCAVLHQSEGCCHYGDTEVPEPEEKPCES